jgi:hypothetical protein
MTNGVRLGAISVTVTSVSDDFLSAPAQSGRSLNLDAPVRSELATATLLAQASAGATARHEIALQPDNFALKVDSLYLSSFPGFYTDTAALPVLNPRPASIIGQLY